MHRVVRFALAGALSFVAVAPPARALDLPGALRQVAASNPTLASRRAMVASVRAGAPAAGAWDAPMLELGVTNVPASGRFDMDPMTMRMVGIEQRVPVSGGRALARRARQQAAAAESSGAAATALELYGATWTAYADAYWSETLLRGAEAHLSEMDRVVQSARARYAAGRGRMEELLQAQAERAAADADVESFGAESRTARAALDALRGQSPGGAGESLAAPPEPVVPPGPSPWLARLDETHPRLAGATADARRYRLEAASARRMTWPDLDLRFGWGFRSTLADGMTQDDMFSASVGVMLPLFAAGRDAAMGRQMDAMARSRDDDARAERLALERDLAGAHADAIAAYRNIALLRDGVLLLRAQAVDAAWSAYGAGVSDLGSVLEQSHAHWNDQIRLIRTRQQLAHALARALTLTGSGEPFGFALPPFEEETR